MPRRGSAPPLCSVAPAAHRGSALRAIAGRSRSLLRVITVLTDDADDDDRVPVNPTPSLRDLVTAAPPRARPLRAPSRSIAGAHVRQAPMPAPHVDLTMPLCVSSSLHSQSRRRSVNQSDHDRVPYPVPNPVAPHTVACPARLPGQLPKTTLPLSFFRLGPDRSSRPPQVPALRHSRFGSHTRRSRLPAEKWRRYRQKSAEHYMQNTTKPTQIILLACREDCYQTGGR